MATKKKFSCRKCGIPFDAYPPDSLHVIGSVENIKGSIKIPYTCKNGHKNVIYWRKRAIGVRA
jgi:hypothetical protein